MHIIRFALVLLNLGEPKVKAAPIVSSERQTTSLLLPLSILLGLSRLSQLGQLSLHNPVSTLWRCHD